MELLALFSTAFVVALSGAMMPGPLLTLTIAETARRGFWTGPRMMVGHAFTELALVGGLMLGLSQILQLPAVTGMIGLLGGVMLVYMGWGIGRDAIGSRISFAVTADGPPAASSGLPSLSPVWAGIVLSLSNPYWILWWMTIGLGYMVSAMHYGLAGIATFYLGHIGGDFFWYSLVSGVVHTGRNWISNRVYRSVLAVCGVFLVVLGCLFSYDGWKVLMQ